MDDFEQTTASGERSPETPSNWLSLSQIQRRADLICRAERIVRGVRPGATEDGPLARCDSALAYAAYLCIKRCLFLIEAALVEAKEKGGAPVPPVCNQVFKTFHKLQAGDWMAYVKAREAEREQHSKQRDSSTAVRDVLRL